VLERATTFAVPTAFAALAAASVGSHTTLDRAALAPVVAVAEAVIAVPRAGSPHVAVLVGMPTLWALFVERSLTRFCQRERRQPSARWQVHGWPRQTPATEDRRRALRLWPCDPRGGVLPSEARSGDRVSCREAVTMTRATQAPPLPDTTEAPQAQSPAGRRLRPLAVVAGIAVIAVGVALGVVVLGDDGDDGSRTTTVESTTTDAPATDEPATAGDEATVPPAPGPEAPAAPVIGDGRHAVHFTGLDVGARTIEFDVIQWLTGEEAREAYTADHPDDPGYPPNDYYVVNENPRLRVLPVAGDVTVTVLEHGFEPIHIAFEDLPAFLADDAFPDDQSLWHNPFWLTVRDDTITAIEEQYIP
jgi:hypothetical protein